MVHPYVFRARGNIENRPRLICLHVGYVANIMKFHLVSSFRMYPYSFVYKACDHTRSLVFELFRQFSLQEMWCAFNLGLKR